MEIKIDSKLRVRFPTPVEAKALTELLTYPNPKYQDNARMNFSNFGVPKEIMTYEFDEEERELAVSRGELGKIIRCIPSRLIDETILGRELPDIRFHNPDFNLDSRQIKVVESMCEWQQGIVHAATSAGKSAMILAGVSLIKRKAVIVVHRKVLLEQLMEDAKRWLTGVSIGQVGAGKCEVADVTFCIDKSLKTALNKHPEFFFDVGCVIQDECHLASTATFQDIIDRFGARKRFGFTGTMKRKDRKEFLIHATFGQVIATITKDELEEAGRTTPIEIKVHDTDTRVPEHFFDYDAKDFWREADKFVHKDAKRKEQAAEIANEILETDPRAKVLILSRYVAPCYEIAELIPGAGVITGKEKDHRKTCDALEAGEIRALVATLGTVSTGVNIKTLTDIILFSPVFSNELLLHQSRGRLMRKVEGKEKGTFHFVFDPNIFPDYKIQSAVRILKKP